MEGCSPGLPRVLVVILVLCACKTHAFPKPEPFREEECPLASGHAHLLTSTGHRLLYEKKYYHAVDCYKRAVEKICRSRVIEPLVNDELRNHLDVARFVELFPKSHHLSDENFRTISTMTALMKKTSRHITPEMFDRSPTKNWVAKRVRPRGLTMRDVVHYKNVLKMPLSAEEFRFKEENHVKR